jgi:DNA-binding CsgD family transcriptional regulator
MSRAKLDIDEWRVERLARHGMSNREIADFFGCDEGTIRGRFSAIVTKGRADRKNMLRRVQWKSALRGNVAMMIWLGKQDLGQSDKLETTSENRSVVVHEKQRNMLRSERAFDLACDLEKEIIHAGPSAYDAASRDDPGGIRPPGQ